MKKATAFCGIILGAFLMGTTVQAETVIRAMNFRSEPSLTGSMIGSVPKDAEVTLLSSQNGWDQISYNGVKGWIHGGNLTNKAASQTTGSDTDTSASSGAEVSGQRVKVLYGMNFRATPGMDGLIIGSVPAGTTVQYLGSSNGWDKIIYNGITGWIASGRTAAESTAPSTSQDTTPVSVPATSGQYVKVLYGMNFRATPGMDGRIMGGIPRGTTVQYLGSSNGWDKIIYNGITGYIASGRTAAVNNAPSTSQDTSPASASEASKNYVQVLYGMNFRATPGMDGRIIGGIPKGTTVQYLGSSNGWDKVVYNGTTGYIASGRTAAVRSTSKEADETSYESLPYNLSSEAGSIETVINTMNFRATGDLMGTIIGVIPAGAKVTYVSSADGWVQVIYNGMAGWIKGGNTR